MVETAITISLQRCHLLAFKPNALLMPSLETTISFAMSLKMPVELCTQIFVDMGVLEGIARKIGWSTSGEAKKIILICGAYLEEQISLAAQFMLMTGFEVYLLRDLVVAKNPQHENIHDQRLIQAGAVPTTLQQIAYEWMATEADEKIRGHLRNIPTF